MRAGRRRGGLGSEGRRRGEPGRAPASIQAAALRVENHGRRPSHDAAMVPANGGPSQNAIGGRAVWSDRHVRYPLPPPLDHLDGHRVCRLGVEPWGPPLTLDGLSPKHREATNNTFDPLNARHHELELEVLESMQKDRPTATSAFARSVRRSGLPACLARPGKVGRQEP